jgi:hypothetical protein
MSHITELAEKLVPFIQKRGNIFLPRDDLDMTEENYETVRQINEDVLRAASSVQPDEEFLLHQVGIASQGVRSKFETFFSQNAEQLTA